MRPGPAPGTERVAPTAVLDKFYDAEMRYIAAGGARGGASFDEMAACLHPQAVMHMGPSVPFPGDWAGIDGVERFFAVLSETWSSMVITDVTYFSREDGVAISMRVALTSRATGQTAHARLAQFITFDAGLIRDFTVFYLDPLRLNEVVGATEGVRQ
ncbi:nuclear transport factor 2 family protein [Amycolatopsis sp. GM8]|uniref:nuclear transport factor 2 family protein n=1 Tax=Amycolatopsis sp. GM8 TaxID=2896530 RepID=UPI001F25CDF8|nr:nuclear transport factor 2 family protein [Amycolatopsis sp. GM8]